MSVLNKDVAILPRSAVPGWCVAKAVEHGAINSGFPACHWKNALWALSPGSCSKTAYLKKRQVHVASLETKCNKLHNFTFKLYNKYNNLQ